MVSFNCLKSYKTHKTTPAITICISVIATESACKSLNFFWSPLSVAVFIAGIKICRAGIVEKNIASKAIDAKGTNAKTVTAAKNELAKTKR
tara:strand:+ start:235 stop:507 length:273 start_codon:yes stop_codon:yes gene_type:complete